MITHYDLMIVLLQKPDRQAKTSELFEWYSDKFTTDKQNRQHILQNLTGNSCFKIKSEYVTGSGKDIGNGLWSVSKDLCLVCQGLQRSQRCLQREGPSGPSNHDVVPNVPEMQTPENLLTLEEVNDEISDEFAIAETDAEELTPQQQENDPLDVNYISKYDIETATFVFSAQEPSPRRPAGKRNIKEDDQSISICVKAGRTEANSCEEVKVKTEDIEDQIEIKYESID